MRSSTQPIDGSLSTLIRISFPLILFLFCESLTSYGERIFLSYYSVEAVASSLNGTYLAYIFSSPCMAIASMAQVFVGLYQGKSELNRIGPCVWQLIWFSFLSMAITLPLSFWSASFYFKGTSIQQMGMEYFAILAIGNFLFPLNTALTSFYLGRGKTAFVTTLLLASYALNLGLCWILIFGIEGFIPSLGIRGAALAKCLSLGVFCAIFLVSFLNRKNRECFGTGSWRLSPSALWSYIQPGMVRSFAYFWARLGWVGISYILLKKGGIYIDVQTIGGTIVAFVVFIITGIYRSMLTIAPNLLGSRDYSEVTRLCRSLMAYVGIIGAIAAIPLLLYPQSLTYFFAASSRELFERTFKLINHWVWLYFIALAVQMGICGIIVSSKDLKVQFYSYLLTYLTSLLPVYLGVHLWGWGPDKLWLIMAIENVIIALIFYYRFRQKKWQEEPMAV